jgi:hypothetical protein
MRHKVAELEGALLDLAVAKAEGLVLDPEWIDVSTFDDVARGERRLVRGGPPIAPEFSSDWQHGGPIIERDAIALQPDEPLISTEVQRAAGMAPVAWTAWQWRDPRRRMMRGATPLRAAMRFLVASKFGDEVELP